MKVRVVSTDEERFAACIEHGMWASQLDRLKSWEQGDILIFKVKGSFAAYAKIIGECFASGDEFWGSLRYPYRIHVGEWHIFEPQDRFPVDDDIKQKFIHSWGTYYGLGMFHQRPLKDEDGQYLLRLLED